jgi:hypothetical protein
MYSYVAGPIRQPGEDAMPGLTENLPVGHPTAVDFDGWKMNEDGSFAVDENGRRLKTGEPDGRIDEADYVLLGSRDPKLIFGFGTRFTWKGFDLNLDFTGMYKYWLYDYSYYFYNQWNELVYGGYNISTAVKDVWLPDNLDGKTPLIIKGMYDGRISGGPAHQEVTFVRLRHVTLGYTIPKPIFGSTVKVYVDGSNLWRWDNMLGDMDPENVTYRGVSQNGPENTTGVQGGYGAYPNQQTFTFGLSINF